MSEAGESAGERSLGQVNSEAATIFGDKPFFTHFSRMADIVGKAGLAYRILPGNARHSFFLALIIASGAAFRFLYLGAVRHGYDEGYPAYLALRLLDGGRILLTGQPSSVFLDNPPLMAYLQAIPLFFWRSIWSVYVFVAALNTVAILFVYLTTRKLLCKTAALLAATLFAVSPWVTHFSRMPWTQGLLPLFASILAWGLWPVLASNKGAPRDFFIAILALTALTQTYILGYGFLLPVAALLLIFFRSIPKRPFYAGLIVFVVGSIPFVYGVSQNRDRNSTKSGEFLADVSLRIDGEAMEHAIRLVTGLEYESKGALVKELFPRFALSRAAHILLSLALVSGFVRAILALRRDNEKRNLAIVLLVWFMSPVLGMLFLPVPVHPHYLLLTLPAGHILAAWGVLPVFARRRLRLGVTPVLVAISGLFWLNLHSASRAVENAPTGSGYNGWALAEIARIGETTRDLSIGDGYPRRVFAEGNSAIISSISGTYIDSLEELSFPDFILLPGQDPLLYVVSDRVSPATLPGLRQESLYEQTLEVSDGTIVSFLRIPPYDRDQALALAQTSVDWTSDAGLTLLGYTLESPPPHYPGEQVVIMTYWRVDELHPDRAQWYVGPFHHVLNAEHQIVANVGLHGQWGDRWQLGDVYVYRTPIPIPDYLVSGEYQLALGLFDPVNERRFSLNSKLGVEQVYLAPLQIAEMNKEDGS